MTTRFRPTPYRDLHLGHVWVAWRNWVRAAQAGDDFVFIADDLAYNLQRLFEQSWSATVGAQRMIADLTWLGMPPTEVVFSSRNAEAHAAAAAELDLRYPGRAAHESFAGSIVRDLSATQLTMYHPWVVMTRVVDDHLARVEGFVRGADLAHEAQLYDFLWRRLYGGPAPMQQYVPCVRRATNPEKESKALGATSLRDLRAAGYSAREIIDTLRECDAASREAGLHDLVIPTGVLEVETHGTLVNRDDFVHRQALRAAAQEAEGYPWAGDVRRLADRWAEVDDRIEDALAEPTVGTEAMRPAPGYLFACLRCSNLCKREELDGNGHCGVCREA